MTTATTAKSFARSEIFQNLQLSFTCSSAWRTRIEVISRLGVDALLKHAVETVDYYRRFFHRRDPVALDSFPLISRPVLQEHAASFRSCRSFRRQFCKTSGTTGPPLELLYDSAAFYHDNYHTFRVVLDIWPDLKRFLRPGRLGVALVTNKRSRDSTTLILPSFRGSTFKRFVIGLSRHQDKVTLTALHRQRPVVLYGKPTYLHELLHQCLTQTSPNLTPKPKLVLVSGETLFADVRRKLMRGFRCKVINMYMSTEGGLLAVQCPTSDNLHVQSPFVHIEVLSDGRKIQREGYGEFVVTNLVNWAMPIIRYRSGDFGELTARCPGCQWRGPTMTSLWGREPKTFSASERLIVSSASLQKILSHFPIFDYTLSRRDDFQWQIQWKSLTSSESTRLINESLERLLRSLGLQCTAKRVDEVTPRGGKARRIKEER